MKGQAAPQNSGHKAIYFISQIVGSKTPKFKTIVEKMK
jgi:hypothetical protein